MNVMLKMLMLVSTASALMSALVVLDRRIDRILDVRWQLLVRSALYAFAFTPTAYHYAPNTIVAPLHLSTIGGNLFYDHGYTLGMFAYGVALPLLCGWAATFVVLLFRLQWPAQAVQVRGK
jgi:hypothetical protein